jgi:DHA1 family bicyclomycin/chloramphenicol resistance-like MFS transporter
MIFYERSMRIIKENHHGISTILSFALIPLSGFATDVYIPSLPSMASQLHITYASVQFSLVVFLMSYGISQLFVGSLLDSFGRYRLGSWALAIFSMASFSIALSHNIDLIYFMRIIQGITVALIVVGKRAYFVDIYSGEQLKNYVSLFSIIWATAPIIAPFLGGYLQTAFGWASNFYFLGIFALVILALELIYGGESLKNFKPFNLRSITGVYLSIIKTADYTLGLVIIALSYSMLVMFGMTGPFIIEHVFHYSPVVTGYCALLSGVSLMIGGIISKSLIRFPIERKMMVAAPVQVVASVLMLATAFYGSNIYTLIAFTLIIHMTSGFVFNSFFAYCLGRFSANAGMVSGITGGTLYILTSFFSYGTVNVLAIQNQSSLGEAFLLLAALLCIAFIFFIRSRSAMLRARAAITNASFQKTSLL